jgi:hypothetical protein
MLIVMPRFCHAVRERRGSGYQKAVGFLTVAALGLFSGCGYRGTSTSTTMAPVTSLSFSGTMDSTTSGSALDPFPTLTWNAVTPTPDFYEVMIGTKARGTDIYYSSEIPNTQTSIRPWGLLPDGHTYYATLWSVTAGRYSATDMVFQTTTESTLPDAGKFYATVDTLTKQVKEMSNGPVGAPKKGSLLFTISAERTHNPNPAGADCVTYSLALITLMLQNRISVRMRTTTVDGTGYEGHTMPEYWDPFLQKWDLADPTFGVVYFNDATRQGQGMSEVNKAFLGGNFNSIEKKFVSVWGDYVYRNYYVDPLSLYLNPVDPIGGYYSPIANDPHRYLSPHSPSQMEGVAGVYLFEFVNATDSVTLYDPYGYHQFSFSALPSFVGNTPLFFSRAWTLKTGWWFVSSPPGLKVHTFPVFWTTTPTMLFPVDQSTEVDPSLGVQFHWTEIKSARGYTLQVGSVPGDHDIYDNGKISSTTQMVTLQPKTQYYVRISSTGFAGYRDSSFRTGFGVARVTTPPDGAVGLPSGPVTFNWTSVSDGLAYALWVGTAPEGHDVYQGNAGAMTSAIVDLQPGTQYYVSLWTQKASNWSLAESRVKTQ